MKALAWTLLHFLWQGAAIAALAAALMSLVASSRLACAVSTTTGMPLSSGSWRCSARNSRPSITGIIMSRRIRHGRQLPGARSFSIASRPFATSIGW